METQKDIPIDPLEHLCLKPTLISALQSNNYFAIRDLEKSEVDYGVLQPCIVQGRIIVPLSNGKDVCIQGQLTKDRVFPVIVPAVQLVDENIKECQVLFLLRTRELCQQIHYMLTQVTKEMDIKVQEITGSVTANETLKLLEEKPQIIIGTPCRILDLVKRDWLSLRGIRLLILDEVDELLGWGYQDQIKDFLKFVAMDVQMGIFSASFSQEVERLVEDCLREPVQIDMGEKYVDMKDVEHLKVYVEQEKEKNDCLIGFFCEIGKEKILNEEIMLLNRE